MKKLIYTLSAIVIMGMSVSSCEKSFQMENTPEFITSSVVPSISVDNENNIYEVKSTTLPFMLNTNVTVTIDPEVMNSTGISAGYPEQENYISGQTQLPFRAKKTETTVDAIMCIEQTIFDGNWTDYTNYGPIETFVNFRCRGTKGTQYVDLNAPENYKTPKGSYYLKGKVKSLTEAGTETRKFVCLQLYKNYFMEFGYTPAVTTYTAEIYNLTIEVGAEEVTVKVVGKQRDKEISSRLASYIKTGDIVEIPANNVGENTVANKSFGEIHACSILKVANE